jgi:AbiV family abortive infection protein
MSASPCSDKDKHKSIVANAERLLADAKLLNENGRYASAFALAILALEEIGKVTLRLWAVPEPKGRRYDHLSKQMAVAALLLGEFSFEHLTPDIERVVIEYVTKPETRTEQSATKTRADIAERLAKAISESEHGHFVKHVDQTVIDTMKQLALYQDDKWDELDINREHFTDKDVEPMFEKCREAISAVSNKTLMHASMRAGKAIFEVSAQRPPRRR